MADFTYEGFRVQSLEVEGMALFENPEDLGAIKYGEHQGKRPASMWQWEAFEKLLQHQTVSTVAFYQQDFGTQYLKPTRLLLGNFDTNHDSFATGLAYFDEQGYYAGPLEARSSAVQLVGTAGDAFATTVTEQWPSDMCKWIAQSVLRQFCSKHLVAPVLAVDGGSLEPSVKNIQSLSLMGQS